MNSFQTTRLPLNPTAVAPDGTDVRILLQLSGGSLAHFELRAGAISAAVQHKTVEEIWYILSGTGQMWRKRQDHAEIIFLEPGVCLTIPLGTSFQFRAEIEQPLTMVAITMPPWPGEGEADLVEGIWAPTV